MEQQREKFNIYILLSILILISYFFGFYLNEDSAGGGEVDLLKHEWGNIQLFTNNNIFDALTDPKYESSRTPLYLIINRYNIFASTIEGLRISYFLFSLSIPMLFYFLLKKTYKNVDKKILLFISTIPLLSPYFRSSAFWANQENLAIFFVIISLIFFINAYEENKKINNNLLIPSLASFFSFLAFYSDQKAVFLVVFIYLFFIKKNDLTFFIKFSLINFIFFIPTIYLFYIWGNILPIQSAGRLELNLKGMNILISSIGIYLLPIILVLIIKREIKYFLSLNFINLTLSILFSLLLFYFLPERAEFEGNGIIFKLLSVISKKAEINWIYIKYFYFFINFIFVFLFLNLFEKKIENLIYLVSFLIIYSLTYFNYQSYVDPLFFILLFGYFKLNSKIKLTNIEYVYSYFGFYISMLVLSILFRKFIII